MAQTVAPKTYLIGASAMNLASVTQYLADTEQEDFQQSMQAASAQGLASPEIMLSLDAKLCYKSLVPGKNVNVNRVRDIRDNLRGVIDTGHGSVLEHFVLNFLTTNCSRVFTHEIVRHRVGAAYSQTSGRYCRLDQIDLVWDPILDPVKDLFLDHTRATEDVVYLAECELGLRKPPPGEHENKGARYWIDTRKYFASSSNVDDPKWIPDDSFDFAKRKKITSAIRRIAPNGQANEIAYSFNIRTLRHTIMARTSRHSEYEIRVVFNQVYQLVKTAYPLMLHGAKEEKIEGQLEITGIKQQSYDPKQLREYTDEELVGEISRRKLTAAGHLPIPKS